MFDRGVEKVLDLGKRNDLVKLLIDLGARHSKDRAVQINIFPTLSIVLAPFFVALAFVQATAFGTLFAALNINYRDVKFALPFLLQVWMIASPVFYSASIVSDKWRLVFALNPLTGILEGFRSAVFGRPFDWDLITVSIVSLVVLSLISFGIFSHLEDDFADVI